MLEKELEHYKTRDFWDTQPVPKLRSKIRGVNFPHSQFKFSKERRTIRD